MNSRLLAYIPNELVLFNGSNYDNDCAGVGDAFVFFVDDSIYFPRHQFLGDFKLNLLRSPFLGHIFYLYSEYFKLENKKELGSQTERQKLLN